MSFNYRLAWSCVVAIAFTIAGLTLAANVASAQHLNPIIEKLSQGKVVVGVGSGDYSIDNAHALSRADIDFVRLQMEHGPIDIDKIYVFLNEMVDRAGILKKGNGQSRSCPSLDSSVRTRILAVGNQAGPGCRIDGRRLQWRRQ